MASQIATVQRKNKNPRIEEFFVKQKNINKQANFLIKQRILPWLGGSLELLHPYLGSRESPPFEEPQAIYRPPEWQPAPTTRNVTEKCHHMILAPEVESPMPSVLLAEDPSVIEQRKIAPFVSFPNSWHTASVRIITWLFYVARSGDVFCCGTPTAVQWWPLLVHLSAHQDQSCRGGWEGIIIVQKALLSDLHILSHLILLTTL